MKGKIIFIVLGLFFFFPSEAYEARISVDRSEMTIEDKFTLTIEISSQDDELEWLNEILINWLENFSEVSRSQSQRSYTSFSNINWNTETIRNNISLISLWLAPKSIWDFIIWPVSLKWEWEEEEYNTNSLNIKVEENKVIKNSNNWVKELQEIIDKNSKKEDKDVMSKYNIYFLILWLLVIILVAYILFYKTREEFDSEVQIKDNEENKDIEKKEDFEESKKIRYPSIEDEKFLPKIEIIFYIKLKRKFLKKDIDNKDFWEILEILKSNNSSNPKIEEIINLINKLKYSNILVSKRELLDLIKQI